MATMNYVLIGVGGYAVFLAVALVALRRAGARVERAKRLAAGKAAQSGWTTIGIGAHAPARRAGRRSNAALRRRHLAAVLPADRRW